MNNYINGYLGFCPKEPEDIKVWYGVFLVLVILVKYYYNIPVSESSVQRYSEGIFG